MSEKLKKNFEKPSENQENLKNYIKKVDAKYKEMRAQDFYAVIFCI